MVSCPSSCVWRSPCSRAAIICLLVRHCSPLRGRSEFCIAYQCIVPSPPGERTGYSDTTSGRSGVRNQRGSNKLAQVASARIDGISAVTTSIFSFGIVGELRSSRFALRRGHRTIASILGQQRSGSARQPPSGTGPVFILLVVRQPMCSPVLVLTRIMARPLTLGTLAFLLGEGRAPSIRALT